MLDKKKIWYRNDAEQAVKDALAELGQEYTKMELWQPGDYMLWEVRIYLPDGLILSPLLNHGCEYSEILSKINEWLDYVYDTF